MAQVWIECEYCDEDGMSGHDCGEDSCCCEDPESNMQCDVCGGMGGFWRELPSDFPEREIRNA